MIARMRILSTLSCTNIYTSCDLYDARTNNCSTFFKKANAIKFQEQTRTVCYIVTNCMRLKTLRFLILKIAANCNRGFEPLTSQAELDCGEKT